MLPIIDVSLGVVLTGPVVRLAAIMLAALAVPEMTIPGSLTAPAATPGCPGVGERWRPRVSAGARVPATPPGVEQAAIVESPARWLEVADAVTVVVHLDVVARAVKQFHVIRTCLVCPGHGSSILSRPSTRDLPGRGCHWFPMSTTSFSRAPGGTRTRDPRFAVWCLCRLATGASRTCRACRTEIPQRDR